MQGGGEESEVAAEQEDVFEFVRGGAGPLEVGCKFMIGVASGSFGDGARDADGTAPEMRGEAEALAGGQLLRGDVDVQHQAVSFAPDTELVEVLQRGLRVGRGFFMSCQLGAFQLTARGNYSFYCLRQLLFL